MTSTLPRNISRLILSLLILLGSGSGFVLFSQESIDTLNNTYIKVTGAGLSGTNSVVVENTANYNFYGVGDTVLLIQMKGVESRVDENSAYGDEMSWVGSPGKYEFLIILSKDDPTKTIRFTNLLANTYDPRGDVQLIRVRSYSDVTLNASLTCPYWDSTLKTGGVLAMIVRKTLNLNNYDIDVSGKGFAGGDPVSGLGTCTSTSGNLQSYNDSYDNSGRKGEGIVSFGGFNMSAYQTIWPNFAKGKGANLNGGGGGSGNYSGGGGGANRGAGGRGWLETCGNSAGGSAGKSVGAYIIGNDAIYLGGGGGGSTSLTAGSGGRGGGIIIILCNELAGNGHFIRADGAPGGAGIGSSGSGGGGAGGSIAVYLDHVKGSSNVTLSANGGNGGNTSTGFGEGGGGGGGLIWTNISASLLKKSVSRGSPGTGGTSTAFGFKGDTLSGFAPVLNGFLFNSIRSSGSSNLVEYVCSNMTPFPVLGTNPVGGTVGSGYNYLWQKTKNGGTKFYDVPGSNILNYSFPVSFTTDTTFLIRRVVTDHSVPTPLSDTSLYLTVNIQLRIRNNIISFSDTSVNAGLLDTICYNSNPKMIDQSQRIKDSLIVPVKSSIFYKWKLSTDGSNWDTISFASSRNYTPPPNLKNNAWYERKVASGVCKDSSGIVKVFVYPKLVNNGLTPDQIICHGSSFAYLSDSAGVKTSGGDNRKYHYVWQKSKTGTNFQTTSFADSVADIVSYNPPHSATDTRDSTYFVRVAYSGYKSVCKLTSLPRKLTELKRISDTAIVTADTAICYGLVPFKIRAKQPKDGSGIYNITWQQSSDSITFGNAITAPVNQHDYQPASLTSTTWYRRVIQSSPCFDTSLFMRVTVQPSITGNTISLKSLTLFDTTICANQLVPFIHGADPSGGTNNPADDIYQWQYSSPGNSTWNSATGTITAPDYQTGVLSNASATTPLNYYYRRSFSSGKCLNNYSNTVTVKVLPKISNNTISADQAVCYNKAPSLLTGSSLSGGDPGLYRWAWDKSADGGLTWTAIASTNLKNYQPASLTSPTSYRRWIYSGLSDCCKDSVNLVNITINPLPISTITPATDTICEGVSKPFTVSITGSVSSPWTLIYNEKYLKTNAITPTTAPSVTTATSTIQVTPAVPGASTDSASFSYTVAKVTDSKGCDATLMSGSRKLVVFKVPVVNAGSDAQNCGPVYTLSGTKNVGTGRWFYPGVPVVDSLFTGNNFKVTIDSTKSGLNWTYPFTWEVSNWNCAANGQVNVTFYKRASQAVTGKYKEIFTNTFSDTLNSIKPAIGTGLWSIVSSGPSAYLQDSIVFNLIAGTNVFKWTVSNGACSTSDDMTIKTNNINIPEGFSPNGDTHNDEFEIQGLDFVNTEIALRILTSAGSQVYTTDNLNGNVYKQWNGENEKGPLPDGTYYYILSTKSKLPPYAGHVYSGVIILKRDIHN